MTDKTIPDDIAREAKGFVPQWAYDENRVQAVRDIVCGAMLAERERTAKREPTMDEVVERVKFNVNHSVRVRLTDRGHAALRKNHDDLFESWPQEKKPVYIPPEEDSDGWSKWQLWNLMAQLGPHIHGGTKPPFETEIEILL